MNLNRKICVDCSGATYAYSLDDFVNSLAYDEYCGLPVYELAMKYIQELSLLELTHVCDHFRYPHLSPQFHEVVERLIQKTLIDGAKNKLRDYRYFLEVMHNMELYCSPKLPGINLSVIGHEFNNDMNIYFMDCGVRFEDSEKIIIGGPCLFDSLDELFNNYARVVKWEYPLIQKYVENICRYLIAKALCCLMEHLSWDMSNLIIDYLA